jgi:hypothetical protein
MFTKNILALYGEEKQVPVSRNILYISEQKKDYVYRAILSTIRWLIQGKEVGVPDPFAAFTSCS